MIIFLSSGNSFVIDEKVMKAELLIFGFICEHNLAISAIADHIGKLFKEMFPGSKIANKYSCSRTKTIHILSGAVAKESISDLESTLSSSDLYKWFGLATMGVVMKLTSFSLYSSGTLQQMVLLQHKGPDWNTMFDACTCSLGKTSLSW